MERRKYDSDDNDSQRPVALSRKRGWGGEELEMNHTREQLRQGTSSDYAAVDLKQFHNTIVGVGYQAKGVVRQKYQLHEAVQVHDMRADQNPPKSLSEPSKQEGVSSHRKLSKLQRRERYIQCSGLREFRRQLEEILSSDRTVQEKHLKPI